jgi:hypothetical protein
MAENAVEVCDASPSYVEANRDEWIAQVGHYCPWDARLINVKDQR